MTATIVVDGIVYFGDTGELYAVDVDAMTGALQWKYRVEKYHYVGCTSP